MDSAIAISTFAQRKRVRSRKRSKKSLSETQKDIDGFYEWWTTIVHGNYIENKNFTNIIEQFNQ